MLDPMHVREWPGEGRECATCGWPVRRDADDLKPLKGEPLMKIEDVKVGMTFGFDILGCYLEVNGLDEDEHGPFALVAEWIGMCFGGEVEAGRVPLPWLIRGHGLHGSVGWFPPGHKW